VVVPDGVRATDDAAPLQATDYTDPPRATDHTDHTDRSEERPFTIGYAGHLYPWKGVDLILEAVRALQDTRGLIVGGHDREPDLARLKQLALDLDCASRIVFTGQVPPPDVPARLREADVLILPNRQSAISTDFTSPLKLFEYMASGRPIVASDLPSFREILRDGENALLVEAGNPQALVAAVTRIKTDPDLGTRLARQAREDVRAFTWARRAERLETLFREITGTSR
jgi:glycosyltransferase involved in cell wall biosynthesis